MLTHGKDCLSSKNKVALSLETKLSSLKTTTSSIVSSIQEIKARTVEAERDVKKAQEA